MGTFQRWGLKTCDEVCLKKRGRIKGDTWWWNEDVKEAVSRKKEAHKAMCQNNAEENKRRYRSLINEANKALSKAKKTLTE